MRAARGRRRLNVACGPRATGGPRRVNVACGPRATGGPRRLNVACGRRAMLAVHGRPRLTVEATGDAGMPRPTSALRCVVGRRRLHDAHMPRPMRAGLGRCRLTLADFALPDAQAPRPTRAGLGRCCPRAASDARRPRPMPPGPGRGTPLLPACHVLRAQALRDKVQWTSRDVAGSEPPTSPRSEHFTGSFNR
ncbi:hypothetical protein KY290_013292 [Solanum tuberosum]|uniref:Uncharacterized protein n=1 Tax=Solanum tuberosum TaxID=4113 RepID=A0ABQ7VH73_SOLTU|nr:hypothetical protein KY284_018428 [Solanum tuberosum]KAH0763422.1 hypothetical protein KY290_019495 [Solanum tuberosum]KAH0768619.1 hypothetical protein KY290_012600 [Solanum tuberosum]KAH0768670.1 hypothetical protein KY290_012651 [Solanum tuberosum]KAH0769311.1 hypothetical protein KY290_013292 [Solanum tuberosum]